MHFSISITIYSKRIDHVHSDYILSQRETPYVICFWSCSIFADKTRLNKASGRQKTCKALSNSFQISIFSLRIRTFVQKHGLLRIVYQGKTNICCGIFNNGPLKISEY